MNVGQKLREERTTKRISQDGLAAMARVSKRSLIYWNQGTKQMRVENADKVFNALGSSFILGAQYCTK
jgi:putative transcriptional regulator